MYFILTIIAIVTTIIASFSSPANGYGLIQNVGEGTCLASMANGLVNGEKLQLLPCDITSRTQQWNVAAMVDYDSGPGFIRQRAGRCLDGNPGSGNQLYLWPCKAKDTNVHLWRIINGNFESTFQLQNLASSKCIEPLNGGSIIQDQIPCTAGSQLQHWRVIPSGENTVSFCTASNNVNPFLV